MQGQILTREEPHRAEAAQTPIPAGSMDLLVIRRHSHLSHRWHRFSRNRAALTGLAVLIGIVVLAVFAPLMHTVNPTQPDFGSLDTGPSPGHWFGTDGIGRDQYSRLLYGMRVPLLVGFAGTLVTVLVGAPLGILAGYAGGKVDGLVSRFTDLVFAFPAFLLALVVVSFFGQGVDTFPAGAGRVLLLSLVFALTAWPTLMRLTRSLTLSFREAGFVAASRAFGAPTRHIVRRHLLVNMWGVILVQAAFILVNIIYLEAVFSILGLGVQPPNPDLGQMLYDGVQRIDSTAWEVFFPTLALTLLILALTFVGDGLRDAFDPRAES